MGFTVKKVNNFRGQLVVHMILSLSPPQVSLQSTDTKVELHMARKCRQMIDAVPQQLVRTLNKTMNQCSKCFPHSAFIIVHGRGFRFDIFRCAGDL